MFWHVCVFSRQLLPGWRKEGRALYLGHSGANTEYPHLVLRDLSEEEFSSQGSAGQQRPQKQSEQLREGDKTGKEVSPLIRKYPVEMNPLHLLLLSQKPHGIHLLSKYWYYDILVLFTITGEFNASCHIVCTTYSITSPLKTLDL